MHRKEQMGGQVPAVLLGGVSEHLVQGLSHLLKGGSCLWPGMPTAASQLHVGCRSLCREHRATPLVDDLVA